MVVQKRHSVLGQSRVGSWPDCRSQTICLGTGSSSKCEGSANRKDSICSHYKEEGQNHEHSESLSPVSEPNWEHGTLVNG